MKQLNLILFVFYTFSLSLYAYDYQTVYSHRTTFLEENELIYSMRIDSAKFQNDSILYPFKNIQAIESHCYTPFGASWLGSKIVITPDLNYFFNDKNDTIKIKTSGKLNDSWNIYTSSEIIVTATITKHDTMSFLGITDSVKTIKLSVFDKTMQPTPHKLDAKEIQISKNYGFVKVYNFIYWPDYSYYYSLYGGIFELSLAGIDNPKLGIQNITWFEVNNFQVGDEIHSTYKASPALGGIPEYFIFWKKQIKKYLSRTDYADSIIYQVEIITESQNYDQGDNDIKYSKSIQTERIVKDSIFDKLSIEPYIFYNYANSILQFSGDFQGKTKPGFYTEIQKNDDELCWMEIPADGCFNSDTYYVGLGGPYYTCHGFMGDMQENKLVYYKKGNETWGEELIINSVNSPEISKQIKAYPNPVSDKLCFDLRDFNSTCTVEIINIQAKTLKTGTINSFSNSINLKELNTGLYFYKLTKNGELIQQGKFIKL